MPRKFHKFYDGHNIFVCGACGTHLSRLSQLISTAYNGSTGQAYLFNEAINVYRHEEVTQKMNSGSYQIQRLSCNGCLKRDEGVGENLTIGWMYVKSATKQNKFKQNKFILELKYIKKQNWTQTTLHQ